MTIMCKVILKNYIINNKITGYFFGIFIALYYLLICIFIFEVNHGRNDIKSTVYSSGCGNIGCFELLCE